MQGAPEGVAALVQGAPEGVAACARHNCVRGSLPFGRERRSRQSAPAHLQLWGAPRSLRSSVAGVWCAGGLGLQQRPQACRPQQHVTSERGIARQRGRVAVMTVGHRPLPPLRCLTPGPAHLRMSGVHALCGAGEGKGL